jgi:glycosyltransferase involved in cell wall biosynthesis
MKVEAYIIAWNESETIHLTVNHYKQFCQTVKIFDNYSDDGTPEICRAMGCEVQSFGIPGVLDDREYTKLKNNCWKGSDADWVIVVDADEIIVPRDLNDQMKYVLLRNKGFSKLQACGWQVMSQDVPRENWLEQTNGFWYENYDKIVCFEPKSLKEIGYIHGCHQARPKSKGADITIKGAITLMHYRNVGGAQRLIDRHALYRKRLSDWNIRFKAGDHYNHDDERRIREWNEQFLKSKEYSPHGG